MLDDDELDSVVSEIYHNHPNTGYKMMLGHLKSRGILIQTFRVQESLRRVDPEGTLMRALSMHTIFYNLETEALLNSDNEIHLYALHWAFLPQVQRHLQFFKEGWNNHKLRTEGNQSPVQLWLRYKREWAREDPSQVDEEYGIDWAGPHGHDAEGVSIPEIQLPRQLTAQEIATLPNPEDQHALSIYTDTVTIISEILDNS
ncbi:hypothetical protein EOD39_8355 [Acipenser ruthenus]|uniref:Integrase core domain-containing protein n=1 Tax=Acipenser ruthenus TaxID=7906 RepID=A0A444U444_ACIRT|nr:hypothetical protein EOD39_8355 [Acipenser ruthenus]